MNRILLKSAMALTITGATVSCQESTFDTAPTADGLERYNFDSNKSTIIVTGHK